MSDDVEHRDPLARLRAANDRLRRLRDDVASSDNVTRFRVERHLEAAEETVAVLNAHAQEVPAAGSYARELLERSLSTVEFEISFAQAKLDATRADERNDPRGVARATGRAMSAQRSALLAQVAPHVDDVDPDVVIADDTGQDGSAADPAREGDGSSSA